MTIIHTAKATGPCLSHCPRTKLVRSGANTHIEFSER